MLVRVGLLSMAHVHAPSYAHCLKSISGAQFAGIWDDDGTRGEAAAQQYGTTWYAELDGMLANCDAVVIASENLKHADLIEQAARAGKSILCEKPLAASQGEHDRIQSVIRETGVRLMTAFPCPFSPIFKRLKERLDSGEIGKVVGICSTNRGTCPGGWFTNPELSGGGAMIDHTVHVADLIRRLLGAEPTKVAAITGNRIYGQEWEDTAMLTLDYPGGVFATLDSSWSRHTSFRTWGDVVVTVTGETGILEADLFSQELEVYTAGPRTHQARGYGSNLDLEMVREFISSIEENRDPSVTMEDGLAASRVALAAYSSLKAGEPCLAR